MPPLPRTTTKAKEIDKQGYLSCLRSSNTLRTNQAPDAASGKARLSLAAEVHDPWRQVASFTGKYAVSRR